MYYLFIINEYPSLYFYIIRGKAKFTEYLNYLNYYVKFYNSNKKCGVEY